MAIESIASFGVPAQSAGAAGVAKANPGGSAAFGQLVQDLLAGEATANRAADNAVQAMAAGKAESLHAVTLAVAQADLQFRLVLELRNRLTEAYQEVTRMQV